MNQMQTIQLPLADYQALVKCVERLEKIVREQIPLPAGVVPETPVGAPEKVTDIHAYTKELQAKYGKYPSFRKALLAERAAELEREEAPLRSRHVRVNGVSSKRKRTRTRRKSTRAGAKG